MTQREQARLQVFSSLMADHMTIEQAATLMGVSARHTRRILAAYEQRGAAALVPFALGVWTSSVLIPAR